MTTMQATTFGRLCAATTLAASAALCHAVTGGQTDTFEDGSTSGWSSGAANPTPPVNIASGGPGGADDGYLLLTSSGNAGAGGRLVAFSGPQWAGDYGAAGITGIAMDLANFGAGDLQLRLLIDGAPGVSALTSAAVAVPSGSGWLHVAFAIDPASLIGSPAATLAGVTRFRLYHGTSASYPGEMVAARLGVDNITAVPEPATGALLAGGLAALLVFGRIRRQPT